MKNYRIISAVLLLIFAFSVFSFVLASALNEEEGEEQIVTEDVTTDVPTTKKTTIKTTTKKTTTTKQTTKGTRKDPYTTVKTVTVATQAPTTATASAAAVVTSSATQAVTEAFTTEDVEETTTEEVTEATTVAKMVSDYGKKYRPLKWLSLIVAVGCVIALIVVNLRYRKKYGKKGGNSRVRRQTYPNNNQFRAHPKSQASPENVQRQAPSRKQKPKLDTSARFDRPEPQKTRDENLDKTAIVDISSFKNKNKQQPEKPKNYDDDLYI